MKQVQHSGNTVIRRQRKNFCRPGDLGPWICVRPWFTRLDYASGTQI